MSIGRERERDGERQKGPDFGTWPSARFPWDIVFRGAGPWSVSQSWCLFATFPETSGWKVSLSPTWQGKNEVVLNVKQMPGSGLRELTHRKLDFPTPSRGLYAPSQNCFWADVLTSRSQSSPFSSVLTPSPAPASIKRLLAFDTIQQVQHYR